MALDIDILLEEMAAAAVSCLEGDAKKALARIKALLLSRRGTFQQLSYLALSDELTEEGLRLETKDEMLLFQSEMLASRVADLAAIQEAANAAGEILM
jgi:hypothetical protein